MGWIRADKAISPEVSEEIAKLSHENRDLRLEKEKLKSFIEDKKPNISITINGKNKLEIDYIEKENLKITFHNNQWPFSPLEYPKQIKYESIPDHLKPYLKNSSELENYNKSLPSKDEIDEYNWLKEIFFRIKGTSIKLNIDIENLGISKANEIYIDVEFPKEILVMYEDDIEDYKHPNNPMPKNPIREAEEKYEKDQARKYSPLSALGLDRDFYMPPLGSPLHSLQDTIANININKEIETNLNDEENKITIKIKSLLHTRKVRIDDFAAIPINFGKFDVKVSIVCEEYSKPKEIIVPVIIASASANQ